MNSVRDWGFSCEFRLGFRVFMLEIEEFLCGMRSSKPKGLRGEMIVDGIIVILTVQFLHCHGIDSVATLSCGLKLCWL